MTHEEMTVHKALTELKVLDARIDKKIASISDKMVSTKKRSADRTNGVTVDEFCMSAKAMYDSILADITRRDAIKGAVVTSNASTMVTVCDRQMSVAQAIDYKVHTAEYLYILKRAISKEYEMAVHQVQRANAELEKRADDYVSTLFSAKDRKDLGEEAMKARADFVDKQTLDIVDPLNAAKCVEEIEVEIDRINTDIDSALSVSNAVTTISVDY